MKMNRYALLLAASVLAAPLSAFAQAPAQGTVVGSTEPGKASMREAIQLQGEVPSRKRFA